MTRVIKLWQESKNWQIVKEQEQQQEQDFKDVEARAAIARA